MYIENVEANKANKRILLFMYPVCHHNSCILRVKLMDITCTEKRHDMRINHTAFQLHLSLAPAKTDTLTVDDNNINKITRQQQQKHYAITNSNNGCFIVVF